MQNRQYLSCKLCDSDHLETLFISAHSNLPITRCSECGLVFLGYRFDAAEQMAFYNDADAYRAFAEAEHSNPELGGRYKEWATQIQKQFHLLHDGGVQGKLRLLDIGCGAGDFLAAARKQGFEVRGQDISAVAAQLASKWNKIEVELIELSRIEENSADIVTLIGLLEHVIDPTYIVQQAHRILATKGLLFICTPVWGTYDNIATSIARISGNRFTRLIDRRIHHMHLQIFPKSTLVQFLRRVGFETFDCEQVCEYSLPAKEYLSSLGITWPRLQSIVANSVSYLIKHKLFFYNSIRMLAYRK